MANLTRHDIETTVSSSLKDFIGDEVPIRNDDRLEADLGLDSIETVELAALVWKGCHMNPQRIELDGVRTVNDLIARVENTLAQR